MQPEWAPIDRCLKWVERTVSSFLLAAVPGICRLNEYRGSFSANVKPLDIKRWLSCCLAVRSRTNAFGRNWWWALGRWVDESSVSCLQWHYSIHSRWVVRLDVEYFLLKLPTDGISVCRYACDCAMTGYTGTLCDVQIDECLSLPCFHGATSIAHVLVGDITFFFLYFSFCWCSIFWAI